MGLTKDFAETVRARAARDAGFRRGMLREAIDCLLAGDVGAGKIILRDYINATIGFEPLAAVTKIGAKSLMRMFGAHGNPQASNLFEVIAHLQRAEGVRLTATMKRTVRHAA
jgi:DNA-binding phage protein